MFDDWADCWRQRQAKGDVILVRYADDFLVGFQHRTEAERFLMELRERLRSFGLELHPDKTRLIRFGRFAAEERRRRGEGPPETFDFLGFTHSCGVTHSGAFQVLRHTARKRLRASLQRVKAELRRRRHHSLPEVGGWLRAVVQGHLNYFAVPTNYRRIQAFRNQALVHWHRAASTRSQRG